MAAMLDPGGPSVAATLGSGGLIMGGPSMACYQLDQDYQHTVSAS